MSEKLIQNLTDLGFSRLEAEIYAELARCGRLSGYSVAKNLNKTRPSVYNALDNLLEKGFVLSEPTKAGGCEYSAAEPELLLNDISRRVTDAAQQAKKAFKELKGRDAAPRFENIEGKSALVATANRIIGGAKKEIVMNSSMPLDGLRDSLLDAARRKVRIILFTWRNLDTLGIPLELYSGFRGTDFCAEERLFLVADLRRCVIGSNDTSAFIPHRKIVKKLPAGERDFLGMTSTNRLIVNMVTEHVHFDIYLNRLRKKYKKSLFTDDIVLNSLMEKGI